jgi:hypothetical protein
MAIHFLASLASNLRMLQVYDDFPEEKEVFVGEPMATFWPLHGIWFSSEYASQCTEPNRRSPKNTFS